MGGKCPLFSRSPNVFRLLILVSGKDNECQVPASSERKSLDVRLLIIQNIDSWMEPTVFTSPRRFRLRKTLEPSTAPLYTSHSRNYLFVAVFPPSCDQLMSAIRAKHSPPPAVTNQAADLDTIGVCSDGVRWVRRSHILRIPRPYLY